MARDETSKYSDLMPDGKARIFTYAMEAKSVITFPSGGQTLPAAASVRADRAGVVRARPDRAGRGHDRRWRSWVAAELAGAAAADRADAVPAAVAVRRPRGRHRVARDRRNRLRPADARGADCGPRDQFHLPLQRHQGLESPRRRDGDECGSIAQIGATFVVVCAVGSCHALSAQSPSIRSGTAADARRDPRAGIGDRAGRHAACRPGAGTVAAGRELFAAQCARCHGPAGEGDVGPRLVGGQRHAAHAAAAQDGRQLLAVRDDAVGLRQSGDAVRSTGLALTPPEVYAAVAYVLNLNGIIDADGVMDATSLPKVRMPNRDGFVADPRPDTGPAPRRLVSP